MPKGYRPYLAEQDLLLPPSLRDWLPENHRAYFVSDVVDQLDLTPIHEVYEKDLRGQPPYDPRMMTKLLAAGNAPNFRTISDFRKIHLATLEGLFEQVLKMVLETGAMKLGRVALDGTKAKANASKHKAMSHDWMKEQEKVIRAEVKAMLARAEAADQPEKKIEAYIFSDRSSKHVDSAASPCEVWPTRAPSGRSCV